MSRSLTRNYPLLSSGASVAQTLQPFQSQPSHLPPTPTQVSYIGGGGIYLAAAATQGRHPSITASPCRVKAPKDLTFTYHLL